MTGERGGRYFREARFFLAGDRTVAGSHILEARSLLGYMRDQHALGGPPIQVQHTTLSDGTVIRATMMNGQFQAQIVSPFSPSKQPKGATYNIWVHPVWGNTYDWLVVDEDGCAITTEKRVPTLYSNRMWQAPDRSIYCIVGGRDQDKYFGIAGSDITKDGVLLASYGDNVVGVAEFMGRLVVVQQVPVVNGLSPARDQKKYKVFVDGVEKLETVVIDAYVDGGYSVLADLFFPASGVIRRFSQTTVMFNQAGSEGAGVLGNAAVIKFSLADNAGDTVVTYAIEAIPDAQATYHKYRYIQIDAENTCVDNFPSGPGVVTRTYNEQRRYKLDQTYTVALACDYAVLDGVETLVYCLLDDSGDYLLGDTASWNKNHVGVRTETGDWLPSLSYPHSITDTSVNEKTYDLNTVNKLYFSDGQVIYRWYEQTLRNTQENSFFVAAQDVTVDETIKLLSLDIKHKFALVHSTKTGSQVDTRGDFTYQYYTPNGGAILASGTSTVHTYPTGWGSFVGLLGDGPAQLDLQHGPVDTTSTVVDDPYDYDGFGRINDCLPAETASEHTLNVLEDVPNVRTDERARYPLLTTEYTYYDIRLFDCFGMTFPDDNSLWDRALVFLRVPTFPEDYLTSNAKAYVVCNAGSTEVTNLFVELNADLVTIDHPTINEPITRHAGVTRNLDQ